ncbi:hypothetical protein T484DRAFT_1944989 [Baffinella frigidus]|nr:hypothetical protein T484DRAFT_1944989 [Cryptophyta sp. CCMP2293]|eukprot:CAMPEP_0180122898 /NCGR_PEP_ID=MMETSP0986-20121125/3833_1 /TAXON_ID=697907 /ORGANISM="non described non described, Strain CCMP2293" /LENGTH=73 /DNA_ID=CAMNT_0022062141 /DNA_START=49 /DNA_END=270 /DNA_ORIENTATION=+
MASFMPNGAQQGMPMQTQQQFAPQQYASRAPPPSGFSSVPISYTPNMAPPAAHPVYAQQQQGLPPRQSVVFNL